MADDVQWPSEDEDFDATINKNPKKSAPTTKKVQVSDDSTPEPDSVIEPSEPEAVANADTETATEESTPEESASEDPAPEEASSEPEEPAPEEDTTPDTTSEPEAAADPEPVEDTPSEPEATPVPVTAPSAQQPQQPVASKSRRSSKGRLAFEALLVLLVIGLGLWAWSLYTDNNNLQDQVAKLNSNPAIVAQKRVQDLTGKVGSLVKLPANETPQLYTVSDVNAAKKQSAFFNNAQAGDKLLIYVKGGTAILYRPDTNKIVNQGPFTIDNNTAATTTKATTPAKTTPTTKTTP